MATKSLVENLNWNDFCKYFIGTIFGLFAMMIFCILVSNKPTKVIIDSTRPYGKLTTHEQGAYVYPYHTNYRDDGFVDLGNSYTHKYYACTGEKGQVDNKYKTKENTLYGEPQVSALYEGYNPDTDHYCE